MPTAELERRVDDLPPKEPIAVVGRRVFRSTQVAARLDAQGLDHALNLRGGIGAWMRRVEPVFVFYMSALQPVGAHGQGGVA